jgi:spore germination protein YaaH
MYLIGLMSGICYADKSMSLKINYIKKDNTFYVDLSHAKSMYKTNIKAHYYHHLFTLFVVLSAGFFLTLGAISNIYSKSKMFVSQAKTIDAQIVAAPVHNVKTKPINQDKKEVIGFLPYWAVASNSKIYPERMTQIIYFGLTVQQDGKFIRSTDSGDQTVEWSSLNSDYYQEISKEAHAEGTKMLIAIKDFDNTSIDNLISNPVATKNLIQEINQLIKDYNIDGVNIDFEYFTDSNFPTARYLNVFFDTLKSELKSRYPNFIISFDVNASVVIEDQAYDMSKVGDAVDNVILMGYDYHTANSTKAGPVAPLYADDNQHSIAKSVTSMMGRVPKDKVVVGLPFYGYEWQTVDENFGSDTVADTGVVATYKRVRELLENHDDVKINWDDKSLTPWLVYEQSGAIKQIYFENEQSFYQKIRYAQNKKLAGIGLWALGYEGDYPEMWDVLEKYQAGKIN